MTREAFEAALDRGHLQTALRGRETKWYTCRRNGKTRLWKRDSSRFEIPIKYRYRDTARIKSDDFYNGTVDHWFRITSQESAWPTINSTL